MRPCSELAALSTNFRGSRLHVSRDLTGIYARRPPAKRACRAFPAPLWPLSPAPAMKPILPSNRENAAVRNVDERSPACPQPNPVHDCHSGEELSRAETRSRREKRDAGKATQMPSAAALSLCAIQKSLTCRRPRWQPKAELTRRRFRRIQKMKPPQAQAAVQF